MFLVLYFVDVGLNIIEFNWLSSENRLLDSPRLDGIFQKIALFDFENDDFPSFNLLLDSFFVENGLYNQITGFDCIIIVLVDLVTAVFLNSVRKFCF